MRSPHSPVHADTAAVWPPIVFVMKQDNKSSEKLGNEFENQILQTAASLHSRSELHHATVPFSAEHRKLVLAVEREGERSAAFVKLPKLKANSLVN